ncbi:hypothetical protein FRC98_09585 [Lujinxingia vulgaris]|uniref:Uncharacterized protein n=1 Tax=Lujinxingia vulgaris TaxID=2600176 RepID=A0A5C6XDT8_9DELT|nr:hypothetical protein [Lujinxingia vulgaris]TXD36983.1 hypothetical protein FRC98_09585 [Lujinxingia vulgaris]
MSTEYPIVIGYLDPIEQQIQICRNWARTSYENLLLFQPHILTEGLWEDKGVFHIVCPNLSQDMTADGEQSIQEWFKDECRIIGTPISLVQTKPKKTNEIAARSAAERANLEGELRSVRSFESDFALMLPRDFPVYKLSIQKTNAVLKIKFSLDDEQLKRLKKLWDQIGSGLKLEVHIDSGLERSESSFRQTSKQGDLTLIPSSYMDKSIGRDFRFLWEEDEDFWRDNLSNVLGGIRIEQVIPDGLNLSDSRCLVDASVYTPSNLRTYLALFEEVAIVWPLKEYENKVFDAFNVNESEMLDLVSQGRIRLVIPHSPDRYASKFLSAVAERAPNRLLLSRRLASMSVIDARKRNPLLFPPLSTGARAIILQEILNLNFSPEIEKVRNSLVKYLGQSWSNYEKSLQSMGAMAVSLSGVGGFVDAFMRALTTDRLMIETVSAGYSVTWGAALNATLFPGHLSAGFSLGPFCEVCASVYSGIPIYEVDSKVDLKVAEYERVLEGILSFDNDAPLSEVVEVFSGRDLIRVRELVMRLALQGGNENLLKTEIDEFNQRVRTFEKRRSALHTVDVLGGGAALLALFQPQAAWVPLAVWLLGMVIERADGFGGRDSEVLDFVKGCVTHSESELVLVSRLRK